MAKNFAAWIPASRARFAVKEAPYPAPQPKDVVIHVQAVAVNPMDYKIQDYDPPRFRMEYPNILGSDGAGTVVKVGSEVKKFVVGDRVMVNCFGFATKQPERSAFQNYMLAMEDRPTRIPEHISFTEAAVLPLSCETAMAGLYVDEFLGLQYPSTDAKPTGKTLLVWGGSSSVGCSVIQMAAASGYDVAVLAGKRNHALCSSLGATKVFDHADPDVVKTVVESLKCHELAGAYDCIGDHEKSTKPCADILVQSQGSNKLMSVLEPPETGLAAGVEAARVLIPKLFETQVPPVVQAWIAEALAAKKLQAKPDPMVVGHGLESIQEAVDTLRKGVSGAKVVATL